MDTTQTNGKSKQRLKPMGEPPLPAGQPTPTGRGKAAAEASIKTVFIPKLKVERIKVLVEGISPLIVHAWGKKAKDMMRAKQQKLATPGKEAKDPQRDYEESRYLDEKGRDCLPVIAFKSAAVEAGVVAGVFKTTLRKAFFVGDGGKDLVPIICPEGPQMREDMVRVGQGIADIRYRAEYRDWRCEIPVEFNPTLISAEQIYNLFNLAGYSVGVGEWRPEKDGQFGRFRVVTS